MQDFWVPSCLQLAMVQMNYLAISRLKAFRSCECLKILDTD